MPRTPIGGRVGRAARLGHRQLAGVSGLPPVRAGRRPPPCRLGRLRAVRAARRPSLPRGGRAAHRSRARRQPLDGRDGAEAPRLRRALGTAGLRLRVHGGRLAHHHDIGASSRSRLHVPEDIERFLACDASALRARRGPPAVPAPLAARRRQRFPVSARRRRARLPARARQRVAGDRPAHVARGSRAGRRRRPPAGRCRRPGRARSGDRRSGDSRLSRAVQPSAAGSVEGRPPRRRPLRARRRRHAGS